MVKKKYFVFFAAAALLCIAAGSSDAQTVTGKTFNCYLYSELDFVDSHITFAENGELTLMRFKGSGRYVSAGPLFAGTYLALNLGFGGVFGDYIFSLTGTAAGKSVFGFGVMNVDYGDERYPFAFWGYELAAEATD